MSRQLSFALVQTPSRPAETALAEFADDMRAMVHNFPRAHFFVYPEYHTCGVDGATPDERTAQYEEIAEPLDGPRVRRLGEIAREVKRWLLPGTVIERGAGGELLNTAIVFSPEGELVAAYRKAFPWRPFEPWTPGTEFVVFDIPDVGRAGLAICYDIWFPEVMRSLAWMGAEVIINPALTTTSDRSQEGVMVRAQAIMNQVFVVSVNSAVPSGTGKSLLVDPEGHVLSEAFSEAETVLTEAIDLDQVSLIREYGTCSLDRPWSQFREGDAMLELPIYEGRIDPARWSPRMAAPSRKSARPSRQTRAKALADAE